jgi:non-ribosomal peptide synthetase component F
MSEKVFSYVKNQLKHINVFNVYGPTEATIWSTAFLLNNSNKPLLGQSLNNESVYLLNADLHLVPFGSVGEICIGGIGLARGYLNRPELTKEKFIPNPYNPTERLYRTGDLGRCREDGNLEYLGRMDAQVKIRGYRIELGEIEQAISSHPHSSQAVVIARAINNTSDKELIAYTTGEATAEELKTYLKERLPSYMVPNYYVHLQCIP